MVENSPFLEKSPKFLWGTNRNLTARTCVDVGFGTSRENQLFVHESL